MPDTERDPAETVIRRAITDVVNTRRVDVGLTKQGLAEAAGVNRQTISRISNGKNYPLWLDAFRLARGLQWTLSEMTAAVEARATELTEGTPS